MFKLTKNIVIPPELEEEILPSSQIQMKEEMKYIVCILCVWVLSLPLQAQSYNDVVEQAMDCVKRNSLVQAERLFRLGTEMETG